MPSLTIVIRRFRHLLRVAYAGYDRPADKRDPRAITEDGVVAVPSAGFIDCRWEAAGWMTPREDSSDDGSSRNTTRAWEGMDPPRLRKQLVRSAFLEVVVTEADGQPYSHAELHVLRKEGGVVLPFRRSATGVTAFRLQPGVTYQVSSFDDKTGYSSPVREITPRAGECDRWNVSLPPVSRRHVRCSYEGVLLKNTYLWASSPETLLGRPIWVDSEGIATLEFRDGTGTIRLGHATRAWLLCLVPDGPRCVGTVDVSRAPIHPGVVETCIFAPE